MDFDVFRVKNLEKKMNVNIFLKKIILYEYIIY